MSSRPFVHLHVHTQYSLLDGAIRVGDLMSHCKDLGMTAVGMTDHGAMYGAVDFQKAAKKAGLKSIIGVDLYMTTEGPRAEDTSRKAFHLTLLAKNLQGYKNLSTIVSLAWLEGKHPQTGLPRADWDLIEQNSEGIICLTGDLGGEVNQHVLRGKMDEAEAVLEKMRGIFDEGCLFIELMDAPLPEFKKSREGLIELSKRTGLPVVATNDCHYLTQDDALAHAILMCIQLGKSVDPDTVLAHGLDTLYIKTPEEMWEAFADIPEACENTNKIAEMIDLTIPLGQVFLPIYDVPQAFLDKHGLKEAKEGVSAYFAHVAREGLQARYKEFEAQGIEVDKEVYDARLEEEIGIIQGMDFPGYFLIVWDFIAYAKEIDVPVGPGRGSGAGSLVAYSMLITDIDPIPYGLLFERFLNPERVSMPDFDIDFCMNRREEVIRYVTEKYGEKNVGQIITYGQLKARACIKDVGRALGMNFGETNRLAALVPDEIGIKLKEAIDREPRIRDAMREDPTMEKLFDIALRLENLNRQAGMHAAGIVISEEPLWHTVPVCLGANGELVTQYAKNEVEEAGLVKFDFLGLKTLTVIDTAVKIINTNRQREGKEDFSIRAIPMDDRGVFKMISSGDTTGVFQLESSGFQQLLTKLKPDVFEDIVAAVALYRPGPLGTGMVDDFIECKHGRKSITYPHPWLEGVLKETYGTIVYQEQVMKIAQVMAGYSLGGADILRRAMGKKKASVMDEQRVIFVEGASSKNVPEEKSNEIFDLMAFFAGYGFNKCLTKNTIIPNAYTGDRVPLGQIFEDRPDDFHVHAVGDDKRLRPRRVTDVVWNGKKPVFELKTDLGHTIEATGNHPFLTLDGWKNLEDLKPGDRIAAPRRLAVDTDTSRDKHEIIALAGLLSEGNTCHPTCLYAYNNDPDYIDDFAQAISTFPNTVARIDHRPDGRIEVCASTGRDTRFQPGMTPWNASNAAPALEPVRSGAWLWARNLDILGRKATEKHIPPAVFTLCDDDLALFMGRLWTGDGFIANATQAVPYYATSSPQLALDVQNLLLRLGMISRRAEKIFKYRGGERIGYTVHLLGQGMRQTFIETVVPHIIGRQTQIDHLIRQVEASTKGSTKDTVPVDVRHWINEARQERGWTWKTLEARAGTSTRSVASPASSRIGYQRGTIGAFARALGSARLKALANSDIYWDNIVSIEPKGIQDTFDLTVEDDHNFVADGLIVHNSHSAAYALITYQTAFLKVHYPVEFMAALMTCDRENTDKVVRFISEAKDMKIQVLPPDANESELDFSVVDGKIRFGLGAIKGVGESAIEPVLCARENDGPFTSLYNFCERVDLKKLNRRAIVTMLKSGAFDQVGLAEDKSDILQLCEARSRMCAAIPTAIDRGQKAQKDRSTGQSSLFGMFAAAAPPKEEGTAEDYYPEIEPWTDKELLSNEKASIGFYVTGHPLDRYEEEISSYTNCTTKSLRKLQNRDQIAIAGVITSLREKTLKSGKGRMAFIEFEDREGSLEVICFSSAYAEAEETLKSDEPLLLKGTLSIEGEAGVFSYKIRMSEAMRLVDARKAKVRKVRIELDTDVLDKAKMTRLAQVLQTHPGGCTTELALRVSTTEAVGQSVMLLDESFNVDPSDELLIAVERLFGRRVVSLR